MVNHHGVSFRPLSRVGLVINDLNDLSMRDTNHLLNGMILQVGVK